MKAFYKILFLAIISATLLSCVNPQVEISGTITVNVVPSTIIKDFVPYQSGQLDLLEDDDYGKSKLHIISFIYGEDGKLTWQDEGVVTSFASNYSFRAPVPQTGNCRMLCFAYSAFDSDDIMPAYSFENVENLSSFMVHQNYAKSFYSPWSILGGALIDMDSQTKECNISLEPLTAYVALRWKDIHANDGSTVSIYGDYAAKATDIYDNSFDWTMTLEQGTDANTVTIKNLSASMVKAGYTSSNGYNVISGTLQGSTITIPMGQEVGVTQNGKAMITGANLVNEELQVEDLVLTIGSDGKLVTQNLMIVLDQKGALEAFLPGLEFSPVALKTVGGVDKYGIIYHNNDYLYYDNSFKYATTLASVTNNGTSIQPSSNPSAINVYEIINLLPGSFNIFGRAFVGNEYYDTTKKEITIQSGKQYVIELDCAESEISYREGLLKSAQLNDDCLQFNVCGGSVKATELFKSR